MDFNSAKVVCGIHQLCGSQGAATVGGRFSHVLCAAEDTKFGCGNLHISYWMKLCSFYTGSFKIPCVSFPTQSSSAIFKASSENTGARVSDEKTRA